MLPPELTGFTAGEQNDGEIVHRVSYNEMNRPCVLPLRVLQSDQLRGLATPIISGVSGSGRRSSSTIANPAASMEEAVRRFR